MPNITLTASTEVADTLCTAFGYVSGNKADFLKGKIKVWLKEIYTAQKMKEVSDAAEAVIVQAQKDRMTSTEAAKNTAETTADSSIT